MESVRPVRNSVQLVFITLREILFNAMLLEYPGVELWLIMVKAWLFALQDAILAARGIQMFAISVEVGML